MKKLKSYLSNVVKDFSVPFPDPYGWPPDCGGMFFQPERPVQTISDMNLESHAQINCSNRDSLEDSEHYSLITDL